MSSISVVIPTYDRARLVGEAIESVLAQSRQAHEIIVVDDGSRDQTEQVVRSFGSRVTYISQPNEGVSAARNRGVGQASGEWVAFLDSDDLWKPRKLAVEHDLIEEHGHRVDWLVSAPEQFSSTGVIPGGLSAGFPVFNVLRSAPEDFLNTFLDPFDWAHAGTTYRCFIGSLFEGLFYGNFCSPTTAVIRKAAFVRCGGFKPSLRLAEDTEFFHRLSCDTTAIVVAAPPLALWRVHHGPSLVAEAANTVPSILNAVSSLDAAAARRPLSRREQHAYRWGRAHQLLRLSYTYLTLEDSTRARRYAREAAGADAAQRCRRTVLLGLASCPPLLLRLAGAIKRRGRSLWRRPAARTS